MNQEDELVRCQCGYIMRRRVERTSLGETWKCYTWHHRTTGEQINYCSNCGESTSALSTSAVTLERGTMPPRSKTRRGVSSTTAGKMADATGHG